MSEIKRFRSRGGFILTFILNCIFNAEWSLPAWILLFLHFFVLHISVWWSVGAFALFFAGTAAISGFLCWASSSSGDYDAPRENKNPYSSGPYEPNGE